MASAPLALACLYFALAAADFDLDAVADPVAALRSGARGAKLLRTSMILDTWGYYLLLAPGVIHLDRALRRRDDGLATLITACGLGYVGIGAIGASVLAAVCPPLIVELEHAVGTERDMIAIVLRAALDAVHGGLWNFLEMLLAAVFWLGSGTLLRATRPRFAALTITVGAAAAIDAVGETIGVAELASVGLAIYLVLAPIWALCLGVLTARELGVRAEGEGQRGREEESASGAAGRVGAPRDPDRGRCRAGDRVWRERVARARALGRAAVRARDSE